MPGLEGCAKADAEPEGAALYLFGNATQPRMVRFGETPENLELAFSVDQPINRYLLRSLEKGTVRSA